MAEEAYYTYYTNSAGEWVEPLSAVELIFVNPAWVCQEQSPPEGCSLAQAVQQGSCLQGGRLKATV